MLLGGIGFAIVGDVVDRAGKATALREFARAVGVPVASGITARGGR